MRHVVREIRRLRKFNRARCSGTLLLEMLEQEGQIIAKLGQDVSRLRRELAVAKDLLRLHGLLDAYQEALRESETEAE